MYSSNFPEGYQLASLTFDEWVGFKRETLREKPYADRVSIRIAIILAHWWEARGPYWNVIDELDHLEGHRQASVTPPGSQFKHAPLFPLWHKHFTSPMHMLRNIGLRWGFDGGGNAGLDKAIVELASEYGDDPDIWPGILADRVVSGYLERARKGEAARVTEIAPGEQRPRGLTGEWIIYAKHEGQNYYLDLATHKEAEEDQEGLYQRVKKQGAVEFPFLFP